jgi:hypothetical protein
MHQSDYLPWSGTRVLHGITAWLTIGIRNYIHGFYVDISTPLLRTFSCGWNIFNVHVVLFC